MSKQLFVRIWDVQHGSAAYVRTPDNRHLAIDLGVGDITGNESGQTGTFSPLRELRRWGIQQLQAVIVTHPHTDHVDDIAVVDALRPVTFQTPRHISDDDVRRLNQRRDASVIEKFLAVRRRYPAYSTSTGVEVERPSFDLRMFRPVDCAVSNLNNQSIVVFLTYAGSTICIPGDNEGASWRELLKDSDFKTHLRKTDIFVASHHGRASGYCEDVFEHLSPKLVIISDGPQQETCVADSYRRKASGWKVYSHSKQGTTDRKVLTTRKDGSIDIVFGWNGTSPYIQVTTE